MGSDPIVMRVHPRAEQIGSLLRPPELLEARAAHAAGRLGPEELRAVEDRAIADALRRQRDVGLDVVSDGEMRRGSWLSILADSVEGFIDDERSGGFEPLRFVPADRTVVLGLVTTKRPALESPDVRRRRIDEAARHVPLERLAVSPQCGFASVAAGNLLSMDDQWRKLELVADTARRVWGG